MLQFVVQLSDYNSKSVVPNTLVSPATPVPVPSCSNSVDYDFYGLWRNCANINTDLAA
jgi:hypothetical protein